MTAAAGLLPWVSHAGDALTPFYSCSQPRVDTGLLLPPRTGHPACQPLPRGKGKFSASEGHIGCNSGEMQVRKSSEAQAPQKHASHSEQLNSLQRNRYQTRLFHSIQGRGFSTHANNQTLPLSGKSDRDTRGIHCVHGAHCTHELIDTELLLETSTCKRVQAGAPMHISRAAAGCRLLLGGCCCYSAGHQQLLYAFTGVTHTDESWKT